MKKFLIICTIAFSVAGCSSLKTAFDVATTTIQNPVGANQQAAVEASWRTVLVASTTVLDTRQCRKSEAASLTNICVRRAVKVAIQGALNKGHTAMIDMRNFIHDNPTIDAITVITAAKNAISDLRTVAASNGVPLPATP